MVSTVPKDVGHAISLFRNPGEPLKIDARRGFPVGLLVVIDHFVFCGGASDAIELARAILILAR